MVPPTDAGAHEVGTRASHDGINEQSMIMRYCCVSFYSKLSIDQDCPHNHCTLQL